MRICLAVVASLATALAGCSPPPEPGAEPPASASAPAPAERQYLLERVDDAAVVQLYADGFNDLPLNEKRLVYHLTQAAIAGRDIYWDQRYVHGLAMRSMVEQILTHSSGIDPATLSEVTRYTKLLWLNLGPLQQNHGPQVRNDLHARGLCGSGGAGGKERRLLRDGAGRIASPDDRADASAVLRCHG